MEVYTVNVQSMSGEVRLEHFDTNARASSGSKYFCVQIDGVTNKRKNY